MPGRTPPPKLRPRLRPQRGANRAPECAPSPPDKTLDKAKGAKGKTAAPASGTSNDRLGFALPNFLTLEDGANVPPLTTGQKFRVVVRSSFDYVQIPWYGFLSGISQAENSEPGFPEPRERRVMENDLEGGRRRHGTIERLHDQRHFSFRVSSRPSTISSWARVALFIVPHTRSAGS